MEVDIIELVKTLGFPIAIVIYLLWERSKVIKELTTAINNNTLVLTKLCTMISQKEK